MTTLVALVGPAAAETAHRLEAGNVSVEQAGRPPAALVDHARQLSERWRRAVRRSSVYTVVDTDPLAAVVRAWRRRLLGEHDELELAIGLTPDLPSPDFYLVDPSLEDPTVHWYVQHLRSLAPDRTILGELRAGAVLDRLAALPFGPGLPSLPELAATARDYVPLPEIDQPFTTPSGTSLATGSASPASRHDALTESTSL